jgi:hypothetical protein
MTISLKAVFLEIQKLGSFFTGFQNGSDFKDGCKTGFSIITQ